MIDAQGNYVPETPQITTPVPTVDASTVYSPQNVATTLSNPVAKPNLADPYGLYDYYMNSADIQGANTQLKSITDQYNQSLATSRAQQTALENLPRESMAWIGTAQQRAGTLANQQLQALSEARNSQIAYLDTLKSRAADLYGIATQERGKLQELIAMTGGKAGISYTDSFESAIQKATKYTEDKAKEDAKDAYKKELKAQLLALGKSTKGLSTNELEKKLKKYNKQALEEAKKMKDLEYESAKLQLAKLKQSLSGGGKKSESSIYQRIQDLADSGKGWADIASTLKNEGVETYKGSPADQYLNSIFGQAQIAPKSLGTDENGEPIYIDSNTGERIYWVE